ncbi:MAG: GNAT family N-acetyltransferase [Tannerellaceae bacterium]|nr:GNAT family N-acetyltransferase [Tannerellaceae bacterium]
MESNIIIREIKPEEIYKLEDMLYETIYQPDENNLIPREVLQIPEVNAYIKNFGKQKDDYCLVADAAGEIIGAVWVRILSHPVKGYGYIDEETPEFAISLFKAYRNQGLGTRLMNAMILYLQEKGYRQTSLNVKKENYAVKLYLKVGFEIISEDEEDYLMLLDLRKSIALRFNDCINKADLQGLSVLMTDNHTFIDMAKNRTEGKINNINKTWKPFFDLFPVYRNIFQKIITRGSTVIMQGYSVCSDECLNNVCAIWVAEVIKGKVSLWHIYSDNEENRKILGI